jgi:hypothetical protein
MPAAASMTESAPNPISAIEDAARPAMTAIAASTACHPIPSQASARARRTSGSLRRGRGDHRQLEGDAVSVDLSLTPAAARGKPSGESPGGAMAAEARRAHAQAMLPIAPLGAALLATAAPGTVLQADRLAQLSPAQTARQIHALTFPTGRARYGVDAFRLRYATTGVDGTPTTASGLLVLPRNHERTLPTVSYTHGTLAARADAPSRSLDSLAGASVLLFASAGYATVAPDYLGLGDGPGRHPYLHAATEASASLDMLRAAHAFAARRHRTLDDQTLVTGFSQGGQAAMALGRALQADPQLRLKALAPMSGPYDVEHAQFPATLSGRMDPAVSNYYVSYAMLAWQPIYDVFDRPQDVWPGRWATRIAGLYDGRHDDVAILKRLPRRLMFTRQFRARLAHPDGGLAAALRANDSTCAWRPRVPVRLYAARHDRQVAFANSRHCAAQLGARLIDVGPVGHFPSTLHAAPRVLRWFERLG